MDEDLVTRAQRGDRQAFEALAAWSHPRLYRVAHGILRDPHLAQDATQQALIAVWRYLPRLREPGRYVAWSTRLLVRACIREARGAPRWLPEAFIRAHEPRSLDGVAALVDRDRLERGFRRLSVEHRAVIVLRYLVDLSQQEVADALGVPVGTAASRLSRALSALRAALEADERPTRDLSQARVTER